MTSLYNNSGLAAESASRLERALAEQALGSGDYEGAWDNMIQVLELLGAQPPSQDFDVMFVDTSLELAKISFVLGKGFSELIGHLNKALEAADRLGNQRARAMINLHLGRLYYFGEQRHLAMEVFAKGKAEAEALGDEDIMANASELIGLYFFIQGLIPEAMGYFEEAARGFEFADQGHSGPMWLSYCAAFLGQYHRAIGTLDFYRRLAIDRKDHSLATTLRAVLGIFLVRLKKHREAAYHLSGALQESIQSQNSLAGYFSSGGLAFHHMMEGRLDESRKWMTKTMEVGDKAGLIHQYASPFVLEILFTFHTGGIAPIPGFNFESECQRILNEPNIHLQGVALRLRAMEAMGKNLESMREIEADLVQSERLLERSGDPVQLGKTHIAMARLKLTQGDPASARRYAQRAWKGFSGYGDVFYPDDLLGLLSETSGLAPQDFVREDLLEMFGAMIQDLVPSDNLDELLQRTISATNRFFGAERGGIFWFKAGASGKSPELRAACNLFKSDVDSMAFRSSLSLVFKTYRENQPQVVRNPDGASLHSQVRAMIGVPFEVEGEVKGVLYHDNSYVNDCFDRFVPAQLARMAGSLSRYIGHVLQFSRKMEEKTSGWLSRMGRLDEKEIIAKDKAMLTVLDQADRIAGTDSTVLILGETGVGKELLARRIHGGSVRSEHPLVVVDPTTIPESLVESELFGHEKGAFTGADRQKAGRIELAHNGTLFIDEVGEIPLSIQVKLLRALQEKTITRVGGAKTISCNFRLIAATNRSLADEVAQGRFREDLYYRLNVIPILLPPLRERGRDVLELARHMLARFAGKYNRHDLELSKENVASLLAYSWPGNVREMENMMERAVLLAVDDQLALNLPASLSSRAASNPFEGNPSLEEVQRRYIAYILEKTNGKISGQGGAAEILGMKRTSLYNRMKKLGMR
ncbi:Transcriptional regulator containing GAF, AAA-type ATPase, and DNA-binding Fis domains [Desulfatibacillum alkenivorans DSM 16219]|jgi:transcriptional regulator with GAF, ATPase, and Fis domain/tetratricopeptide (TPR) repeat protein|uniref:Transcriptional regulator containing GAF, AAA-type ATPase, and DNA-binding Fis domains n=1 Tax=Desulfatibacillum alkenivorans DSM 16219 TaxID=1121393 RepID=A0A1M6HT93_9BACT|nr:sigma 54-interacting transcriptional regulator [Desulfatibacillum alkenivorans]SHJ25436.1 Transcriptional regulator containing GAF, AAA-type ATPase, and DNA-binding Fis domains [Desulfatibacillum alkenivorans DSM 16219]